ncbi:MAG: endonuclease III [Bacteroidales bacterium]|jgi:endonuclease-3|nr:endonuclease III [Bacteroidales bacterium]
MRLTLAEKYKRVIALLNSENPNAETELQYRNPYELLVAVILSAQCTDKRINAVTPQLFNRFPSPEDLARADEEEIYSFIKSVSYPKAKSHNLSLMAKRLVEVYNSKVPSDTAELETLAGVGRKTANVIASVVFKQAKMPVDTHVHRVSARIGLTKNAKNVLQTEQQLMKNLKGYDIALIHHQLILHGRYVCKARRPLCEVCPLQSLCSFFQNQIKK